MAILMNGITMPYTPTHSGSLVIILMGNAKWSVSFLQFCHLPHSCTTLTIPQSSLSSSLAPYICSMSISASTHSLPHPHTGFATSVFIYHNFHLPSFLLISQCLFSHPVNGHFPDISAILTFLSLWVLTVMSQYVAGL
jgi:hypothetical protein